MTRRTAGDPPVIEGRGLSKRFGHVQALSDVGLHVRAGEVLALLGDNGAGKSTLIKILSGVYPPDSGELLLEGAAIHLASPRDARSRGIATVYQDLAIVDQLSISRNFFLGAEPVRRIGPIGLLDIAAADRLTTTALADIGVHVRSPSERAAVLSGGERQSIAIARAVHFGAKVLILDEPTSALGVKETAKVLTYIANARNRGLAVILITHNLHHAIPVADRFSILDHGCNIGTFDRNAVSERDLIDLISGGRELAAALGDLGGQDPHARAHP